MVAEDEEEGGEGAPLFHPPKDIQPLTTESLEAWGNANMVEEVGDQVAEPGGEASFVKDTVNPAVVNRVKGLLKIEEEKIVTLRRSSSLRAVEGVSKGNDVVVALSSFEESLLVRTKGVRNRIHNGPGSERGDDAVVSIGN